MAHHAPTFRGPRSSSWLALALAIATAVTAAPGCGGGGNDALVPAHSTSFAPVRGVGDNGAAVSKLHWLRRVNGGQPIPLGSDPSVSIQFSDSDVTAEDDVITSTVNGTVLQNGATVGHESVQGVQHLSPGSSPATVSEEDDSISVTISMAGVQVSENQMLKYVYTPPLSAFDRDDLDSMPVGTTGSLASQASVTGSATTTATGQSPQTQTLSETIPISATWTLTNTLATFQVLGQDYANVVVIQMTSSATSSTTGTTAVVDGTFWFAKGIGLIRSEESGTSLNVAGPLTEELVSTNLVP
jgi:hypothetical protein